MMTADETTALVNQLPNPDTRRALAIVIDRHEALMDEFEAATAELKRENQTLRTPLILKEADIIARRKKDLADLNKRFAAEKAEIERKAQVKIEALEFDAPTAARLDAIDVEIDRIDAAFEAKFDALDSEAAALVGEIVCDVVLCAKSGLPILDGDAVLTDDNGDRYLRLALGLPLPESDEGEDADDEAHDPETGEVMERVAAVPFEGDDAGFKSRPEVA